MIWCGKILEALTVKFRVGPTDGCYLCPSPSTHCSFFTQPSCWPHWFGILFPMHGQNCRRAIWSLCLINLFGLHMYCHMMFDFMCGPNRCAYRKFIALERSLFPLFLILFSLSPLHSFVNVPVFIFHDSLPIFNFCFYMMDYNDDNWWKWLLLDFKFMGGSKKVRKKATKWWPCMELSFKSEPGLSLECEMQFLLKGNVG